MKTAEYKQFPGKTLSYTEFCSLFSVCEASVIKIVNKFLSRGNYDLVLAAFATDNFENLFLYDSVNTAIVDLITELNLSTSHSRKESTELIPIIFSKMVD